MGAALALAAAFAFANAQGTQLLATGEIAGAEAMRQALCTGGRQVSVEFERRQAEGRDSTGRHTPQNFAKTAGAVFRIVGGTVNAGTTCLLAADSVLSGGTSLPLMRPPPDARCSKAAYPEFQSDKNRAVVGCWPIAESGGVRVAILEFSRRLTQALASVVVIDGERRMYVDYPAEFKGPGADLWRVDDGGEIHAANFDIVMLLKRGSTYVLAVDWAGSEGNVLSLHVSEGAGSFTEIVSDAWYRSPL